VETFGNVTLEALSSGCPSIVEKKCGEHLVDHGVNGLTCQCGDAEGFYQVCTLFWVYFVPDLVVR
jgi:glycosyltransferase involved in cell wall biosynthesis